MHRCLLLAALALLPAVTGASAQTAAPKQPTTAELIAGGFEVKAVINNTYLILQKGDKAFWCGSSDPSLTWANWPLLTREAACVSLTK